MCLKGTLRLVGYFARVRLVGLNKKLNLIKFSENHGEPEGRSYWLHVTTVDYGFHLYGEAEEDYNGTLV